MLPPLQYYFAPLCTLLLAVFLHLLPSASSYFNSVMAVKVGGSRGGTGWSWTTDCRAGGLQSVDGNCCRMSLFLDGEVLGCLLQDFEGSFSGGLKRGTMGVVVYPDEVSLLKSLWYRGILVSRHPREVAQCAAVTSQRACSRS